VSILLKERQALKGEESLEMAAQGAPGELDADISGWSSIPKEGNPTDQKGGRQSLIGHKTLEKCGDPAVSSVDAIAACEEKGANSKGLKQDPIVEEKNEG